MKRTMIILGFASLACLLCMPVVARLDPAIAEENGVMENFQIILALLASAVFLARARGMRRELRGVLYSGALFGFACAMRENEVRSLDVPRWVELLFNGLSYDIIIGSLSLAIAFFVIKSIVILKTRVFRIPRTSFAVLTIAAAVAMLVGDAFENDFFNGDRALMYEEYFETIGYFLLLAAALSAGSLINILATDEGVPGEVVAVAALAEPVK